MSKTVLVYGLIIGALSAGTMFFSIHTMRGGNVRTSEVLGYTSIVLAMLLVFFGIRSYRENAGGGKVTFLRGLGVGVAITLIASGCYVATWQAMYFSTPGLGDQLAACMVDHAKASGATPEQLDAVTRQTESYKKLWANPLTNAAVTFLEPFPVGVAAALISAAVLRKR